MLSSPGQPSPRQETPLGDAELGEDARFEIHLPRAAADVDDAAARAPARPAGQETVLVVDDEDAVREIVSRVLEARGYRILEAADAAEALSLSSGYEGEIHLLLTDVVMPGIPGPELAAILAGARPETRVLFMSGFPGHPTVGRSSLVDASNLIEKPFTAAGLAERVRAALDEPRRTPGVA
jgi:two-component system cell cycle sensor histidine kinase/response regulator CckA